MQGIKITVVGLDGATKSIQKLAKRVSGKQLITGVLSGAQLIQNRAKELVKKKTGTAMRSIHMGGYGHLSPDFDPSEGYEDIGGNVETEDEARIEVGTNLVYAPRLEFGFVGKDSLGRVYNQPANPYLRPAFDEKQDACMQEISDALDQLIDEALG